MFQNPEITFPLALPSSRGHLGHLIQSVLRAEKIQFNSALVSSSTSVRKNFVIHTNLSGTLMTIFSAQKEIRQGQLIPLKINHPDFITQSYLIVRRSRPLSRSIIQLLGLIEKRFSLFSYQFNKYPFFTSI